MEENICYQIKIKGQVDENDLNAMSPLQVTVTQIDKESTSFSVSADQSGLIGVLRHLHGRGLVILSINLEK
jgi:hypothetical protein